MNPKEIVAYFEDRRSAVLDLIAGMVNIESPSFDAGRSSAVVSWVEEQARTISLPLEIERIPADNYGEHLIIRAFHRGEQPTLLVGHTDTVHPVGTNLQNPTRIEGDKFYGCGIFDMKANVVLMLEVLRYFAETGESPAAPIKIFLSCDEEVGSYSGRPILEREAAGAAKCFVFEPSFEGAVKTGRKGTGMFKLRARGVPAHAGLEPEKGANAVAELARQVEKVHAVAKPDIGTTVNVTTFRGGTTLNVIPEHAECEIDVRFASAAEAERVSEALAALAPVDGRVSLELSGGPNRMPLERNGPVIALYEKARDLAASFGYQLDEKQVGGGSDGNFVAAMGIAVLDGLGIKGDGAHTLHEHVLVSDIATRATLVTKLLLAN